jgi:hypothetical protein
MRGSTPMRDGLRAQADARKASARSAFLFTGIVG